MTRHRKYWGKKLYKRHIWMETTPDGKMYKWLQDEMQKILDQEIARVVIYGEPKPQTHIITVQDIIDAKNKMKDNYYASWMGQMGISVIKND